MGINYKFKVNIITYTDNSALLDCRNWGGRLPIPAFLNLAEIYVYIKNRGP